MMNGIPPPVGVHSRCHVCSNHFIPLEEQGFPELQCKLYAGRFTDNEAQRAIDRELRAISDDSAYIKSMLQLHGDAISRRWIRWKVKKRGETLCDLAPACFGAGFQSSVEYFNGLPRPAGTSIQDWTCEGTANVGDSGISMPEWMSERFKHGCSRMTPWIYIQEFAENPMRLMSLLHCRSEYTSRDWAAFDTRETLDILGRPPLSFMAPIFNAKCVKMYGDDYGRLVGLDPSLMHTGATFGFPRAHLTFRVQSTILSGLRKIVDAIAHGVDDCGDGEWSKLVSAGFQSSASELRWGVYFSQAYVPPSNFDPVVLLDMARTQLNNVKDRVEFLQTDPEYMCQYALKMVKDIYWEKSVSRSSKWAHVSGTIITIWTISLLQWQAVVDISEKLVETCRAHHAATCPGQTLPRAVATVFQEWILLVEDVMHVQIYYLKAAVGDMRAMNDSYKKSEQRGKLQGHRRNPEYDRAGQKRTEDRVEASHRIEVFVGFLLGILEGENAYGARSAMKQVLIELSEVEADERVDDVVSTLSVLDAMRLQFLSNQLMPYHRAGPSGSLSPVKASEYCLWMMWPQKGVFCLESNAKKYAEFGSLLFGLCNNIKWPDNSDLLSELDNATAANLLDRSQRSAKARAALKAFWQGVRDNWSFLSCNSTEHADLSVYRALVKDHLLLVDRYKDCMLTRHASANNSHRNEDRMQTLRKEETKIGKALEEQVFPCLNQLIFGRMQASIAQKVFEHTKFDLSPEYLNVVENEHQLFNHKIQIARSLAQNKNTSRTSVLQSTWGTEPTDGIVVTSGQGKVKTRRDCIARWGAGG